MAESSKLDILDTLDNAVSMLQFLTDIAPALAEGRQTCGISEAGSGGLALILEHINNTINQARELI